MANIFHCAYYLIRMAYSTIPVYGLNRGKLNLLLSIVQFYGFMQNKTIFEETMGVNQCGTSFPVTGWLIPSDIQDSEADNIKQNIEDCQISTPRNFPPIFKKHNTLNTQETEILKKVFKTFYAWSGKEIGLEINKFVDEISNNSEKDARRYVSFDKAKEFFNSKEKLYQYRNNAIIKFLIENDPDTIECPHCKQLIHITKMQKEKI